MRAFVLFFFGCGRSDLGDFRGGRAQTVGIQLFDGGRYVFGCLPLYLLGASLPRPLRWALAAASAFFLWKMGVYYMQGQAIM